MDQITAEIDVEAVRKNAIFTYTNCFDQSSGKFDCMVAGCKSVLANKSSAIRHLKKQHAEIYHEVEEMKKSQTNLKSTVEIIETPARIWHAILQLVIFCALPFSIVQEWGFKLLIKPYVTAFESTNTKFAVNRTSIRSQISEQAKQIKEIIIGETKGKMICLLLDIASRYNRSVLGISIVYYNNGLCTRTIGMETLKISQTAKNLFDIVKTKLNDYGITLDQVFAVTTDNGKNLIKMTKMFQDSDETHYESESDEEEPIESDCYRNEASGDEFFDPDDFNNEYFHDLLTNLRCEFPNAYYNGLLTGISCGAHCLNLVVTDAIKVSAELSDLIDKCRSLVKKLRTPSLRAALKEKSHRMAILDVKTRWSSLYDMLNRLIELRDFCETISPTNFPQAFKLLITPTEWETVEKTTLILKHFAVLTKSLQKEQFSLSDFFGGWAKIKMEMFKMNDDTLAKNLLEQMRRREDVLFNNPVLNAAVFLDPRYQQYMPTDNKQSAIEFLVKLNDKMRKIECENRNDDDLELENVEMDQFLCSMLYENNERDSVRDTDVNSNNANEPIAFDVPELLRNFIGVKEPLSTSVFDYWEKNKHLHPMLYKLACVIHSVPPTQTTVERSFSAMALILGPLRTRISDDNLENSLLIRLNRELFNQNIPNKK